MFLKVHNVQLNYNLLRYFLDPATIQVIIFLFARIFDKHKNLHCKLSDSCRKHLMIVLSCISTASAFSQVSWLQGRLFECVTASKIHTLLIIPHTIITLTQMWLYFNNYMIHSNKCPILYNYGAYSNIVNSSQLARLYLYSAIIMQYSRVH